MPPVEREAWLDSLRRTRNATMSKLASLFGANELSPSYWEDLEAALILADLGPKATRKLVDDLRDEATQSAIVRASDLRALLRRRMVELATTTVDRPIHDPAQPYVILVVGVNGSGKTTAVARLARSFQRAGKRVLLAAADTYRAAAKEQLARWATRLDMELVDGAPGSDPGAVVYRAGETAQRSGFDVVIIDTSGRMHTSHNLMAELEKIQRVAGKVVPGAPDEILLVLDATTGQNGLSQARGFTDAVSVTGVIVTKLDTSARGGAALAVGAELGLPIRYVGHGEGPDDLSPFDPEAFVDGLIPEFAAGGRGATRQDSN
jgi:fused signal recognition particle receptor